MEIDHINKEGSSAIKPSDEHEDQRVLGKKSLAIAVDPFKRDLTEAVREVCKDWNKLSLLLSSHSLFY